MIIERNIAKYLILADDTLLNAIRKISENKNGIIFAISDSGVLEGVLTDGDFRRWIVGQTAIDLNVPMRVAMNSRYLACSNQDEPEAIAARLSDRIRVIPLLDRQGRITAIANRQSSVLKLGEYVIDNHSPTFVIAEIGNNHNGSPELARRLVDEAIAAGANCAKFQLRNMRTLYNNAGNANDISEDLGSQYTLDLLARFQLSAEKLFDVFSYCRERNILPLCTPWDTESLTALERYGMVAYKVASADLTNHDLIEKLAATRKPLLCSTGMSTEAEIVEAVRLLKRHSAQYALLHCNSTYPAPFKDVNLVYMNRLRAIGGCPVGYSGHERGIAVAIGAVANGAKIIEKHFTLDRNMEGNDHRVSLLPTEFRLMVQGIREVEQAIGNHDTRKVTQGELMNREVLGKSLIAVTDIAPGQLITEEMIAVRSPGRGLSPNRKRDLIGRAACRPLKTGDMFFSSDVDEAPVEPRAYHFRRPFGVPVRYHDLRTIATSSNFDLLEFHLSYKDLDENPARYLEGPLKLDLVVHSPELFAGDHLMDLCARDVQYRRRSIRELQRVIEVTHALKPFFIHAQRPRIIINAGGFTLDGSLPVSQRAELYEMIASSLMELDTTGVEILPQTMPPFPWHFGGQRFHNLFMDPSEIVDFCRRYGFRTCLDISHSKLTCTHLHLSFKNFLEQVGPCAGHLHIVDASGVDGEGLQIGTGEIDFTMVAEVLNRTAPEVSFIPEIWQGHKNKGAGFWEALAKLERWF